jgi:small conductance mechanosensitive channel
MQISMMLLGDIDFGTITWSEFSEVWIGRIVDYSLHFVLKLIACLLIYFVGRKLIKYLNRAINRILKKEDFDQSVVSFLISFINVTLTVALLVLLVNIMGVKGSSFVALFASIGVAFGMALSGTLQNFAGGVMVLLFRPYRVGDYIQAQGYEGTVNSIQIFSTVIITSDNRSIYIPNGGMSSNVIVNNNQNKRRIEWEIGVDYGTNYDHAKMVVQDILKANGKILSEPEPFIALKNLKESSVDLLIRVWVKTPDYWDVYFTVNEQIYKRFPGENINIPFPQMTVHLATNQK